jgi:hypothetical protein
VLVAVGAALRLNQYVDRRSLWIDEAMLALNLATRSFAALFHPLDYGQTAPLLFLWAERLTVAVGGVNELALRAVPLAGGLALLGAVWPLARRLLSPVGAALAVGFTALSPLLNYYSNELKPYGTDALVTVLLLLLALRLLAEPREPRRWGAVSLGGAVAVWASSTAVFVLAGIGLALVAHGQIRRRARGWLALAVTALAWGTSFGAAYLTFHRATAQSSYMQRFWGASFFSPSAPDLAERVVIGIGGMVSSSFFHRDFFEATVPALRLALVVLVLLAGIVGVVAVGRRHGPSAALLLVAPIGAAFGASALRLYPVAARLMAFSTPLLILAFCAGVDVAAGRGGRRRAIALGAAALLLVPAGYHSLYRMRVLPRDENSRPVIVDLLARYLPGEPVYVMGRAIPQWVYYTTDWSAPDTARLRFAAAVDRPPAGPAFENAPTRGRPVAPGEGHDLVYPTPGRLELFGTYSGMEAWGAGQREGPDVGWAENEAARIRLAARPCAWVIAANYARGEVRPLLASIEAAGGQSVYVRTEVGAQARRVCFAASGR